MKKVVISACYGGFGLSKMAMERLAQLGVPGADEELKDQSEGRLMVFGESFKFYDHEIERHNPALVQVVEELGEEANGAFAYLKVVQLRGDRYIIDEYDGFERVVEPEDIDWIIVGD